MSEESAEPSSDREEQPEPDRQDAPATDAQAEQAAPAQASATLQRQQQEAGTSITRRMRGTYDSGQADLIFATVAKDLEQPGERAMFLEVCARHEFDPFIKEIWAYKRKGRVVIQVSRDGLLSNANRYTPEGRYHVRGMGQFLGCQSNTVYEHDFFSFRYEERPDGTEKVIVDHQPRNANGQPTFGGDDSKGRGKMVGSWARVRRMGHDDVFFQAFAAQYVQKQNGPVWDSHPHAMMQKCAESVSLRKAFSISGVVGEGEMIPPERATITSTASEVSHASAEIDWPADLELREQIEKRVQVLGYRKAKVRMVVNACKSEEDYWALIARLDGEIDMEHAGAGDPEAGDPGSDAPPIEDAVVVDEEPAPLGDGA